MCYATIWNKCGIGQHLTQKGGGWRCCLFLGHIVTEANSRVTVQSDRNYRANSFKVWWGKLQD